MLLKLGRVLGLFSLIYFLFIIPSSIYANLDDVLIVSYATARMNNIPSCVQGVLVTPTGEILKTAPMGVYEKNKIVIKGPEEGIYNAYYESLIFLKPRMCYTVGGIDAHLCNAPDFTIPFIPSESHIQGFDQSKAIEVGDRTLPAASFAIFK